VIGVQPIDSAAYFTTHGHTRDPRTFSAAGVEGRAVEGPAKGATAYYAAEGVGQWWHRGENKLGLEGQVDPKDLEKVVDELRDPNTGEQLGERPRTMKTSDEHYAKLLEQNPDATPEEQAKLRLDAEKMTRHARHGYDITPSAQKSVSVLHAALLAAGRHEEAAEVVAAHHEGRDAMLDKAVAECGVTKKGPVAGPVLAGRSTQVWAPAGNWFGAHFDHFVSRSGDPQLHSHTLLVNRTWDAETGKWRAVAAQPLFQSKHGLDATYQRTMEESLSRRLGVRFVTTPDGKSREVMGIDQQVRDHFSTRARAVNAEAAKFVDHLRQAEGRGEDWQPTPYEMYKINEKATLKTREAKPAEEPSEAERFDRWNRELRADINRDLADVLKAVDETRERPAWGQSVDREQVVKQALADLEDRSEWKRSHLEKAISDRLPDRVAGEESSDITGLIRGLAEEAERSAGAVTLKAPDPVDVPERYRTEDGRSLFDMPGSTRYTTAANLEREDSLIQRVEQEARGQTITPEEADRLLGGHDLGQEQRDAAQAILTGDRYVEQVVGPAGTGKSRLFGALSDSYAQSDGHGLTGFTTAQNAAEVLKAEGMGQAFNISRWLDYDAAERAGTATEEQRAEFGLHRGGTVVIDEASMVDTRDMASLFAAFDRAGVGKVVLAGDPEQLDAVGAGGAFSLLNERGQPHTLTEVRRQNEQWERDASTGLREGNAEALLEYDRHGRIHGGDAADMEKLAVRNFTTDHLSGRDSLIVTPTQEKASDMASQARQALADRHHVASRGLGLHDQTIAGAGDTVQTRRNDWAMVDPATGQPTPVVNRETWHVKGTAPDGSMWVQRDQGRDEQGNKVLGDVQTLPPEYVKDWVELGYAGTGHATQGRTLDSSHALPDEHATKSWLYVATSRGTEANHVYQPLERNTEKDVREGAPEFKETALGKLAETVETDDRAKSAHEVIREEQDRAESLGHLGPMWQTVHREQVAGEHLEAIRSVFGDNADRVVKDEAAGSVLRMMRSAEARGHDPREVLEAARQSGRMDGAQSWAKVLHHRMERDLSQRPIVAGGGKTQDRAPQGDDERSRFDRDLSGAIDRRFGFLGEKAAEERPGWLSRLGEVPEDPAERQAWQEKAGHVAGYREWFGHKDDEDPIGRQPSKVGEPERWDRWNRAAGALGMSPDERDLTGASDGELANRQQAWQRTQEWLPPNVDDRLKETKLAHAEARAQVVDAKAEGRAADAEAAAERRMAERAAKLEKIAEARQLGISEYREQREQARAAAEEARRREAAQAKAEPKPEREKPAPKPAEPKSAEKVEKPLDREPERQADDRGDKRERAAERRDEEKVHKPEPKAVEPKPEPKPAEPKVDEDARTNADLEKAQRASERIAAARERAQAERATPTPKPEPKSAGRSVGD